MQEPPRAVRRRILAAAGEPERFSLGWLWPAWAVLSTAALGVACVLLFTHHTAVPTAVRTVTVPAGNPAAVAQLERENERLLSQLKAQLAVKPVAPAEPSRVPGINPELSALRTRLEQESASSAAERAKANGLEAELALQKGLVAAAQRELQEANRRYAAANPDEAQRQLAAAAARSRELEREVEQYRALLAIERRRVESNLQLAGILSSPALTLLRLRGTEKGRSAEGHALVMAGSQVVFYGSQLPALPPGRTYQLWLIRARAPAIVSAGIFNPDPQNRGSVQFSSAALTVGVTAIAVTEEPAGGSEKPTGHKILVGQG